MAPIDPERFLLVAKAYELIPAGYWTLLSVIVGFYFGGRMQLKQTDMKLNGDHLKAAKELVAMRKEFREFREEEQKETDASYEKAIKSSTEKPQNPIIKAWRSKK